MISLTREHAKTFELEPLPRRDARPTRLFVFNVPRAASVRHLGSVPGWERVDRSAAQPNVIELRPTDPARPAEKLKITVKSRGGPPDLAKRVFVQDGGSFELVPDREAPTGFVERKGTAFGPKEFLQDLHQALYKTLPETAVTRYRRFFFELNRHSESTLLAHNPFKTPTALETKRILRALPFVRRALSVRTECRMREHLAAPFPGTPFHDPESFRGYVETISSMFLRLLLVSFHTPQGALDSATFEEAFEMFATGELRYWLPKENVSTIHPNSGAFFLFGEFALLAAECGVETDLWTRLANVMVRAQPLYCATYPADPKVKKPCLDHYQASNFRPDNRPTQSIRNALRRDYTGFGLRDLSQAAIRNLQEHAPGEFDLLWTP